MDALNNHAEVMTKHLTQRLINLCRERPASQPLAKLGFDHVERRLYVRTLVVRTMQTVEMEAACEFEPRRPLDLLIKIHSTLKS